MNLIIDLGNTNVKLAAYSQGKLINKKFDLSKNVFQMVTEMKEKYPSITKGILASVGRLKVKDIKAIQKQVKLLVLDSKTKLPFKNAYSTPDTLGVDRVALVSASVDQFPNNNVLIIDAGTCITYDFITSENIYLGGAISPGIRTRYKALNNLTANLPLLETKAPKNIIGRSTATSIHSGVIFGVLKEIDGVIEDYNQNYKDLTVILTGGDAKLLSKRLKSSIFANPNFLLEGLNYILEFNN